MRFPRSRASWPEPLDTWIHGARFALHVPDLLPWARRSPALSVRHRARRAPGDLALAYNDERYSWRDVDERADRYAAFFAGEGVGPADVVALLMDNRPDFLFALTGLSRVGAAGSLVNTHLRGPALAHALRACGARKLLCGGEHAGSAAAVLDEVGGLSREKDLWIQTEGDDAALPGRAEAPFEEAAPRNTDVFGYIYTSGTTGLPKPAVIRNQRMLGAGFTFGCLMHRCGPGDLIYVPLPLYHSSAMFLGWSAALATGAAVGLRRRFSASGFWPDVRRLGATSFLYVGELCRYLLQSPPRPGERDHSLRVAVGNGLRPDVWERFQERFGIPVIREFYGATEGNTPILNLEGRPGMIGRLGRGTVVVRCDPATGEVRRDARGFCVRARPGETGLLLGRISRVLTFDGYADPEATRKKILTDVFQHGDRYFDTGDLVRLHEKGWLSFADRLGDTFRWKGENVSTTEVATILDAAPGVVESNVYGVAVPGAEGRAGMAALRVEEGFDPGRLAAYVRESLAAYQRPLFLRLVSGAMPTTSTFKHRKVDYREQGYDLERIADPLYVLREGRYVPLDGALLARIRAGEVQAW